MRKLLGLFLLALAFLLPVSAEAANRFWVGGTGTWDSTSTTNWAATSGGASGASAPVAGDTITFDASSGGGTVTPDSSIDNIAFASITAGAFTGTLAFNTNNPNMTFGSVNFSGSGTRTINMGSGTWTITGTSAVVFTVQTVTGLTFTASSANLVFSGNAVVRLTNFGTSFTYGSLTINNNSTKGYLSIAATTAVTFGSVTVGSGNTVGFPQGITTTITGALTITGTSSAPSGAFSNGVTTNFATVSVGSASTIDWGAILRVTKAGAGSITATNSFDLGGNTGITISGPSGGGGGGRIIGG